MQNMLSSVGAELEKDRCKGVEMRELKDTEKDHFTGPLPSLWQTSSFFPCAGQRL